MVIFAVLQTLKQNCSLCFRISKSNCLWHAFVSITSPTILKHSIMIELAKERKGISYQLCKQIWIFNSYLRKLQYTYMGTVLHFCCGTDSHTSLGMLVHCWVSCSFGIWEHCCTGTWEHCWTGTVVHCCWGIEVQSCLGTLSHTSLGVCTGTYFIEKKL